jgi:hypothetical protein
MNDFSKVLVRCDENKPRGQHFAIVVISKDREWSPGWDRDDQGTSTEVKRTAYYWTTNKSAWEAEIKVRTLMPRGEDFFAFEVKGLAQIRTEVEVELP